MEKSERKFARCVKCGVPKNNGQECLRCGVIYSKAEKALLMEVETITPKNEDLQPADQVQAKFTEQQATIKKLLVKFKSIPIYLSKQFKDVASCIKEIPTLIITPISTFSVQDNRFNTDIFEPYWRLLFRNFQISKRDCNALRFDGIYFHSSRKMQLHEVTHISLSKFGKVRVLDDTLPCSIRFRYSRIDGGPDRRYGNNWRIMECQKYIIKFHGKKSGYIKLFDLPYNSSVEPEALVVKVNRMLSILNHHTIKVDLKQFGDKLNRPADVEKSILTRQRIEAMKIVNAYFALPNDIRDNDLELEKKYNEATRAVESIDAKMKAIANAQVDESELLELLSKKIADLKKDHKISSSEINEKVKNIKAYNSFHK